MPVEYRPFGLDDPPGDTGEDRTKILSLHHGIISLDR
jgi:hypothetical protein